MWQVLVGEGEGKGQLANSPGAGWILKKRSQGELLVISEHSWRTGEAPEDGRKQIWFLPMKERAQFT